METCAICGRTGLSWVKRGNQNRLAKHFCISSKSTTPVMGKVVKDPLAILSGVTLTNEALENGLLEELGL